MGSDVDQDRKGITQITVGGFKSIATENSLEIRPLTILAGTNSSGKTSFVQPLLLLKQTLESPYDPGPLLLNGPNVKFTSGEQLLYRIPRPHRQRHIRVMDQHNEHLVPRASEREPAKGEQFEVGMRTGSGQSIRVLFRYVDGKGFQVERNESSGGFLGPERRTLRADMKPDEIRIEFFRDPSYAPSHQLAVVEDRCFLRVEENGRDSNSTYSPSYGLADRITGLAHLPGRRGSVERTGPTAAGFGTMFRGTFENYVASLVYRWGGEDKERLARLNTQLKDVGLTREVEARRINDAQIELYADRFPPTSNSLRDLVNIADVGFGVSTTLPVLVVLVASEPEQAVYIEEPEIHLHPKAQVKLATVLADAARRGVKVIAETHSSLLLRGIQTLVAQGRLDPALVKLHWFTRRDDNGATEIRSADLDANGAFRHWPMDFDQVELGSDSDYLDAVEARMAK